MIKNFLNKFWNLSIRHKISLMIIPSAFVIVFAVSAFMIAKERSAMLEMVGNNILMQASVIGSNSVTALLFDDRKTAEEVLSSLSSSPNIISAALYNRNNETFAVYAYYKANKMLVAETPLKQGLYYGEGDLTVFKDIYMDERYIGKVSIRVNLKEVNNILKKNALYTIALMFALFMGTLVLSKLIQRLIVNPVVDLKNVMDGIIEKGDYSMRASKRSDDEVGRMVDGFNDMLSQIQRRDEEEKRLLSEKEKMLQDLHDRLGGIITNIKLLSEMAHSSVSQDDRKKICASLSELANEGLSEIRGLMYSLDDARNDRHMLTSDLRRYGSGLTETYGINFGMEIIIDDSAGKPGSLISINLFRIYKEALNNTIKHSGAKNVKVVFNIDRDKLSFSIHDDGVGIRQMSNACRGITNMRKRVEEFGGRLTVTSENGTRIYLEAPVT